ncbi:MAG: metal ABC transporter solute-binding protein, Zn/Mn family [Pseudomonadota bacterium]
MSAVRVACFLLLALVALPAAAGTRVVASVYPLALVTAAVASPDTEIRHLVPGGASTHDYQLSPGDLEAINGADIVVWSGPEAEPYLAAALAQPRAGQRVITLSTLPGILLREHRLDPADTKNRGRDPHLWLSTRNATLLASAVAAQLGTGQLAQNFANEMQRYRNRQGKRFASLAQLPLLVSHDAYGYLFDEFGLLNVSAVSVDPGIAPSARRVSDLAQRVEREKIACMVGEPGFTEGIAPRLFEASLASGGKANLVVLDPQLMGIGMGRDSYVLSLIHLADTLYNCLVTR